MTGPGEVEIIRPAQWRAMPWKNGRGTTQEIARGGGSMSGNAFDWRISLATVEVDGPFSPFRGFDRTIMLIKGRGMRLDFGERGSALVERSLEPHSFSGDWETTCHLLDGAVQDLNVMTRRASGRHTLEVLHLDPTHGSTLEPSDTTLVFALSGDVLIQYEDRQLVLNEHETFLAPGRGSRPFSLRSQNELCAAAAVRITRDEARPPY